MNQLTVKKEELEALSYKKKVVPKSFFKSFGCLHCEWRSTDKCELYDKDSLEMEIPTEGYCDKRQLWVLSLIPEYDKIPTLSQVQLDFNKRLGTTRMLQEYEFLNKMEAHLERLIQENEDPNEIKSLRNRIEKERWKWAHLWKELTKYEDLQVNRETTKKIDITQTKKVRPSDVADLIKQATINVTPSKSEEVKE